MKKKGFFSFLVGSGLIFCPVVFVAALYFIKGIPTNSMITGEELIGLICVSLLPMLIVSMESSKNLKQKNVENGREVAKYPRIPEDMLYKQPEGFCFGTYKGKYVCKRVDESGSILVQGGSGTGKSASIIQGYLLNPINKETCNALVLDLKHELADKCVLPEEMYGPDNPQGNAILLDPLDRMRGYGYDPFFMLDEKSTDGEVHEVMEVFTNSVIPTGKGDNQVWGLAAQQFLRGACTYFYKYEDGDKSVPGLIKQIKARPIGETVDYIVANAPPDSTAYLDMISFKGMAAETITSVDMNMSQKIVQFSTSQDLIWCLASNPRKCSPKDLLEKNIYLCIPEDKLQQWGQLVFLVFNQTLSWMMSLPEHEQDPTRKRFAMILDETVALLAGIGAPIPLLSQCLRIGARGKGCTMLVCCQSIAGLYSVMGKEEVKDMVSNMQYKYILDSTDTETSKEIIGWCGKYLSRKISSSGGGSQRKDSTSYEEQDIVTEQDLVALPKEEEIILVSSRAGYLRLKKCFVFKDKYYKPLLTKVKEAKSNERS